MLYVLVILIKLPAAFFCKCFNESEKAGKVCNLAYLVCMFSTSHTAGNTYVCVAVHFCTSDADDMGPANGRYGGGDVGAVSRSRLHGWS